MEKDAKIYIAGHGGLVGSALTRRLENYGYHNLTLKAHSQLDLLRQQEVERFFSKEKPDYVFLLAAKVGGIKANITEPAEFIYENLQIQNNVIQAAYLAKVKKLLFFGSACSYPRLSAQPMKEEYLLTGSLEPTNEPYAVAKIAGIKMCQAYSCQYGVNFISAILANAYGPHDNFDQESSHVIPALIKRFHEAKVNKDPDVKVWGTGKPRREFIYVDDVADASIFLMDNYDKPEIINLCVGEDISIGELAEIVKGVVGYNGRIVFDTTHADGIPCKVLDTSKLKNLGWQVKTGLEEGIKKTYAWYLENLGG